MKLFILGLALLTPTLAGSASDVDLATVAAINRYAWPWEVRHEPPPTIVPTLSRYAEQEIARRRDEERAIDTGRPQSPDDYGSVRDYVAKRAIEIFGLAQWPYLEKLLDRESNFNPTVQNPSSTAYGLFQLLAVNRVGCSMSLEGQVDCGFSYIAKRFGTPKKAWQHHKKYGWY